MAIENPDPSLETTEAHSDITPPHTIKRPSLALGLALFALILAGLSCALFYKAQTQLNTNELLITQLKITTHINSISLQKQRQKESLLQAQVQQLITQTNPTQMSLSEAAHFVRAAETSLIINTNVISAIHYLQLADAQMASLNNPRFQEIRTALNQDLTQLKALPPLDQKTLMIKLDAIGSAITQLPTVFKPLKPASSVQPAQSEDPYQRLNWKQRWKQRMKASLNHLRGFIVIRHNTQLPVLTPEQQDLLGLIIQFKLLETQWAVIKLQQPLYQHNLQLIEQWIEHYYQKSSATTAALAQLKVLEGVNLQLNIPSITHSLQLIETHLKENTAALYNNPNSNLNLHTQSKARSKTPRLNASPNNPPIHTSVEA